MKQFYASIGFCILTASIATAQNGTENQPLTVAEGLKKTDSSATTYWVTGYVVGEHTSYSNNKHFYEMAPPFNGADAYLIADSKDEYDLAKCMTVQLSSASFTDEMSLEICPENWRKKITVCGLLRTYMNRPGVKSINTHYFEENTQSDAANWNFLETFDEKSYIASSSSSTFAGGVYSGENGSWSIKGGTWGDTGNDNKWGRAAMRLRLTEGSTGDKGELELISDKENGLGEIRFWAGNYQEDASKTLAVALYYSTDKGNNWKIVNENITIKRGNNVTTNGMSEYRFAVNQPGSVRIRIKKADNTSGGINIDKIRLSDYRQTSGIASTTTTSPIAMGEKDGLRILNTTENPLMIYSVSGQLLYHSKKMESGTKIYLPSGIYLVKNGTITQRIVVR